MPILFVIGKTENINKYNQKEAELKIGPFAELIYETAAEVSLSYLLNIEKMCECWS